MDITLDELKIVADRQKFDVVLLEKDYVLTKLLYLLKDVKGMYFKGGTALNKLFLEQQRLSEDLDFTLTQPLEKVEANIRSKLKGTQFTKITQDKRVDKFVRIVIHYKMFYDEGTVFLDLNERAKLLLKPQNIEVPHFYPEFVPSFKIACLHKNEMIAEKVMAACERYKPRDYFDVYQIIKRKLPISISLIKKKFRENNMTFKPALLFKNTNRIYNQWNDDLLRLTKSLPSYPEMIHTLKEFFKYRR